MTDNSSEPSNRRAGSESDSSELKNGTVEPSTSPDDHADTLGSERASQAETAVHVRTRESRLASVLAVAGVTTYAIAAPLFGVLGGEGTFFVAHNSESIDVIIFALAVLLLPILLVAGVVLVAQALNDLLGRSLLTLSVGSLGALALLQAFPSTWYQDGFVHVGAGVALTVVLSMLYLKAAPFRQFVRVLGYTTPLTLGMFLFTSSASEIVFSGSASEVGMGAQADTDVVLLVFDELSLAGLLDEELNLDSTKFPNFAELAETSTWYDRATTVSPRTQWAVPSILTGQNPNRDQIPTASVHPQNLFTTLAPSHQIDASEIVTRLCPQSICAAEPEIRSEPNLYQDALIVYLHTALPRWPADRWLPPISDRWAGFGDDSGPAAAATPEDEGQSAQSSPEAFDWLNSDLAGDHLQRWERTLELLGSRSVPTVSYHHSLVPHAPYTFLSDGSLYNGEVLDGLDTRRDAWESDQAVVDTSIRRYVQQIQLVDRWIGQAMSKLKDEGRFDTSLIVITADHGTSLTAGLSRRSPTVTTAADVAYVPLFVKYPNQTVGERDHRQAQTIDVFPTVSDVLELPLSTQLDGRSLVEDWTTADRSIFDLPPDLDFESVLDLSSAVERITSVVPGGATGSAVYATLDGVEYGGRDVASFDLSGTADATAMPDRADLLDEVALDSGFVPSRFSAKIAGLPLGQPILIFLNGNVASAVKVGEWKGDALVTALLDPSTMVEGTNRLELFALDGNALRSVTIADASAHEVIVNDEGRVESVRLGEEVWESSRPGLTGFVSIDGDSSTLRGWSADIERLEMPHTLILLENGRVFSSGFRRVARVDVSDVYGPEIEDAGFEFALSPEVAERAENFTILALFDEGHFVEFP